MIWNMLKQMFWCGIFHKTKLCMDLGYPDVEPTSADIGQQAICVHCKTVFDLCE